MALALGAYYAAAGIDWPRETAGRLLVIASTLGAAILGAVLLTATLEGHLTDVLRGGAAAALVLGVLAGLGARLQRD